VCSPAEQMNKAPISTLGGVVLFGILLCGFVVPCYGATATWTGGGTDDNWTTADNWGGTAPNAGDDLVFTGSTRLTPVNDFPADTSFASVTFSAGAQGFNLSGNRITLSGSLTNSDDNTQIINFDINIPATQTVDVSGGHLTLRGVISGAGGVTKAGSRTLTLTVANTFTGAMNITAGSVLLAGATNACTSVSVSSGASLEGAGSIAGTVNVANGGFLSPGSGTALTASFVASSLRGVNEDDWRVTRTITGTRVDTILNQPNQNFGTAAERAANGIGGNDGDWDHFSVQWDGYLRVLTPGTSLLTSSDDGSRVWLDLNDNGLVDPGEWGSNGWGNGQGETMRVVHASLPLGAYRMRVQYEEGDGGNVMRLLWDDAANSAGGVFGQHLVPAAALNTSINTLQTGAVTFNSTSTYRVDLDGTVPSNDQLSTPDSVACAGMLVVGSISNSAIGKTYTIIDAGSISGTFVGLADGSMFLHQGRTLQIAYTATQVTLTDVVHPTTRVWVGGGADNNWTTGANWNLNVAPVAGDDLQFDGTTRLNSNNDLPNGTSIASITFNSGAGAFVLNGNRITLTGSIVNNDDTLQTINHALTISATQSCDTAVGDVVIGGVINGAGGLTKSGTGMLTLTATHTYSGITSIDAGTLQIGNGTTSGSIVSASIVNNGILIYHVSGVLTTGSVISGNGSLTKNGAGALNLTANNTYSGPTTVNTGNLTVTGATAATSAITVKNSATIAGTGTVAGSVVVENGGAVAPGREIPLTASFVATSLRGVTEDDWRLTRTISGSRDAPSVHHPSNAFGTPAERAAFGISGNDGDWNDFSVQWDGFIRVVTPGTSLYTYSDDGSRVWIDLNGNGAVDAGEWGSNGWGSGQGPTLRVVHASLPAGIYRMRIQYEEGSGGNEMSLLWDDSANSAGSYAGQHVVPATVLISTIGTLTTGSVTFNTTSNYTVDLDGIAPTFDQISTTQAVTCAGNLTFGTSNGSTLGKVYTIIDAGSVSGTFNGLANGNMLSLQGRTFQIAYTATQVTLTDVARPTRIWDGGGADNNWTTAANWDYDLAPIAGDDLQFAGMTRLTPSNDFSSTSFKSISFNTGAGNFVVGGNALTLSNASAITSNATAGTMTLNTNVTFTSASTISSTAGGALIIAGTIANGGFQTTVAASGSTSLSGVISGTGGLTKSGSALVTLSGANTYSGATLVNEGVLAAGVVSVTNVSGAFGNNSAITLANTAGAAIDITGFNTQIGSLTGGGATGGDVILGSATLTIGGDSTSAIYGGVISGAGHLVKINNGTLTLSNINTYGGSTSINGGTIQIGHRGAINPVTIDNHNFETPNVGGFLYNPSGASWTFNSAGIDRDTGTWYSTIAGHEGAQAAFIQINGSISQTVNVGTAGLYEIKFQAQGRGGAFGPCGIFVQVDGITYATYPASSISQAAWIEYVVTADLTAGAHTLAFVCNNTLGGDKSVCVDNIRMTQPTGSGALPATTAVNLNNSGVMLDLNGTTQTVGSIAGVAGSSIVKGNLNTGGSGTSTTFAGVLSDFGKLTKTGAGTFTLTGSNTYSGGTAVQGGILRVGDSTTNGTFGAGTYEISAGAKLYLDYATASGPTWANITGAGTLELNSAQAVDGSAAWGTLSFPAGFTGTLQIDKGRCEGPPSSLGGTTAVVVQNGAQFLAFDGTGNGTSYSYPQNFSLNGMGWGEINFNYGSLRVAGMNATFAGAIALVGNTGFFTQAFPSCSMTISGVVSGVGDLSIFDQAQGITLTGANTYTGATSLPLGRLTINSIQNVTSGASALGAPTTVAAGTILLGNGNNACALVYTGSGNTSDRVVDLSGSTGAITLDNSGSGLFKLTSAMTATGAGAKLLTLQGSSTGNGEIAGSIVNSAGATSLTKAGSNTWTLSGTNTYTGPTAVNTGTLLINGSVTSNSAVSATGRLGGNGTITGDLSGAGQIAPGATVGATGTLQINGNFTSTGTVDFEVNAPASVAGTHYDQLIVNGAVDISGAQLTFSGTAGAIAQNQTVTLIQNDLSDPTIPSNNPTQNTFISINGNRYIVFYNGNGGNDVLLISFHPRRASQFLDFFP